MDEVDADVAPISAFPSTRGLWADWEHTTARVIKRRAEGVLLLQPYRQQRVAEGFFYIDAGDKLIRGITMAHGGNIATLPSAILKNFEKLTRVVEKVVKR